jgi:hypothetical protein
MFDATERQSSRTSGGDEAFGTRSAFACFSLMPDLPLKESELLIHQIHWSLVMIPFEQLFTNQ